jgi:hypothetical protein
MPDHLSAEDLAERDWTTAEYVVIGGQLFRARRQRGFDQRWMMLGSSAVWPDSALIALAKEELNPIVPVRLTTEDEWAAVDQMRAALASGEASDGYHTHAELYEYRMLYNAHAARGWFAAGIPVVKSWKHDDGELCFGGGWFIVTATLPSGQVSNHYEAENWHLFAVPEVEFAPEWDGHTPADAAQRLLAALAGDDNGCPCDRLPHLCVHPDCPKHGPSANGGDQR